MNATMGTATDAYSVCSTRSGTPGPRRAHCRSISRARPLLPPGSSSATVTSRARSGGPISSRHTEATAPWLAGRPSATAVPYLDHQRRLVGRGETQHGADHRGRRADPRLKRP